MTHQLVRLFCQIVHIHYGNELLLYKDSSISSASHLLLTNAHFNSLGHLIYMHKLSFCGCHSHFICTPNVIRGGVEWEEEGMMGEEGVQKPIHWIHKHPHAPMHKHAFYFQCLHAREVFLLYVWNGPITLCYHIFMLLKYILWKLWIIFQTSCYDFISTHLF